MLDAILDEAQAKTVEGERIMTEGRRVTLYAAHDGVPLTVGKVESVRVQGALLRVRNDKGDIYVLSLEDLFAASVDGGAPSAGSRKAGFLG